MVTDNYTLDVLDNDVTTFTLVGGVAAVVPVAILFQVIKAVTNILQHGFLQADIIHVSIPRWYRHFEALRRVQPAWGLSFLALMPPFSELPLEPPDYPSVLCYRRFYAA